MERSNRNAASNDASILIGHGWDETTWPERRPPTLDEVDRYDAAWLAMILDWFPPAAFTRALPPVGARSVDYAVHLHRPAPPTVSGEPSWLAGTFRADTAVDGLALEHGVIATPDGVVLAESFHTRIT